MHSLITDKKKDTIVKYEKRLDTLIEVIDAHGVIEKSDKEKYAYQEKQLLDAYDLIEVRFIGLNHMGSYLHWVAAKNRYMPGKGVYHLYCNFPSNNASWMGVNPALTEKLEDVGISVVSSHNVNFWKYMMYAHFEMFIFFPEYIDENELANRQYRNGRADSLRTKYITYSEAERNRLEVKKRNMGIFDNYVCISLRDDSYTRNVLGLEGNYADLGELYRGMDIELLNKAVDYLQGKGIQVVRMGARVEKEYMHPNVVDYANMPRDEELDAYIVSKCKFFITDLSGITALAYLSSVPIVIIGGTVPGVKSDMGLIGDISRDLIIFKKAYDNNMKKYISFREMLDITEEEYKKNGECISSEYCMFEYFFNNQIVFHNNSEEEILQVTMEMNEKLDGTYSKKTNICLQDSYQNLLFEYENKGYCTIGCKLGDSFVENNRWVLN